jgi:DNA polymerase
MRAELPTAVPWLPERPSLTSLRRASAGCRGCHLWKHATQTVFGEGKRDAPLMLVGETPGNDEDLAGRPFVGAAGRLLDRALEEVGIERSAAYVTNVVKHF